MKTDRSKSEARVMAWLQEEAAAYRRELRARQLCRRIYVGTIGLLVAIVALGIVAKVGPYL